MNTFLFRRCGFLLILFLAAGCAAPLAEQCAQRSGCRQDIERPLKTPGAAPDSAPPETRRPPPARASPVPARPIPAPAAPPRPLQSPLPAPTPAPVPVPSPPSPVTTCDPGGCWDTGAGRYQGGAGNIYLDKNGKLCQRYGNWIQCF